MAATRTCLNFKKSFRDETVVFMTSGPQPELRWLTDEEQQTWQAYMHASTLLEDHLDRQLQRDASMPHTYYGLMVLLERAPRRRMRMTELARSAKITRSRLSHAVSRLEKYGWVRREDCASDKRPERRAHQRGLRGAQQVRARARRGGPSCDLRSPLGRTGQPAR